MKTEDEVRHARAVLAKTFLELDDEEVRKVLAEEVRVLVHKVLAEELRVLAWVLDEKQGELFGRFLSALEDVDARFAAEPDDAPSQ